MVSFILSQNFLPYLALSCSIHWDISGDTATIGAARRQIPNFGSLQ
jgi:hypothetical protein